MASLANQLPPQPNGQSQQLGGMAGPAAGNSGMMSLLQSRLGQNGASGQKANGGMPPNPYMQNGNQGFQPQQGYYPQSQPNDLSQTSVAPQSQQNTQRYNAYQQPQFNQQAQQQQNNNQYGAYNQNSAQQFENMQKQQQEQMSQRQAAGNVSQDDMQKFMSNQAQDQQQFSKTQNFMTQISPMESIGVPLTNQLAQQEQNNFTPQQRQIQQQQQNMPGYISDQSWNAQQAQQGNQQNPGYLQQPQAYFGPNGNQQANQANQQQNGMNYAPVMSKPIQDTQQPQQSMPPRRMDGNSNLGSQMPQQPYSPPQQAQQPSASNANNSNQMYITAPGTNNLVINPNFNAAQWTAQNAGQNFGNNLALNRQFTASTGYNGSYANGGQDANNYWNTQATPAQLNAAMSTSLDAQNYNKTNASTQQMRDQANNMSHQDWGSIQQTPQAVTDREAALHSETGGYGQQAQQTANPYGDSRANYQQQAQQQVAPHQQNFGANAAQNQAIAAATGYTGDFDGKGAYQAWAQANPQQASLANKATTQPVSPIASALQSPVM